MNIVVIKQTEGSNFFVSTKDSIVIDFFGLSSILKFMLFSGILSPKLLEGILAEYHDMKEE